MAARLSPALLSFLLIAGCRDGATPPTDSGAPAAVAQSARSATDQDAAVAPDASTSARAGEARRIVRAWNEALDKHDVDALAPL